MKRSRHKRLIVLGIAFFIALNIGWAGPTGKVAGVVIDKKTREPLIGVNVILEGTFFGSSTDLGGHYSIIDVQLGI